MASLMPPGKQQYLTASGTPLMGGKLYTYAAGTTSPLSTYSDKAGLIPNTNPVILDARGEASIFWGQAGYRAVLKDANDSLIWTQDNLYAIQDSSGVTFAQELIVATAGQTVFNLGISYIPSANSLAVYSNGLRLSSADFAETSASVVTLTAGADLGDELLFVGGSALGELNSASLVSYVGPAGETATVQDLATSSGASLVGYMPFGAGAIPTDTQTVLRETVSIVRFGALLTNTNAQNKVALQLAITAYASTGAVIVVPSSICYGYNVTDKTTWPSFAGVTAPILINDFGPGTSYAGFPTMYDGMQNRVFMFTPQTTSAGQHDGNTQWLRGAWSPNLCISNDMDLSGARTALDNRRVGVTLFVNGSATWKIGQGTTAGAALTDEVLSNFMIQKYAAPGDTLGDYSPLLVERLTGNMSYGGGANVPSAHHHFKPVAGSPNNYDMMVESLTGTAQHVLRTSAGAPQDVILRNLGGVFGVNVPALGDALQVDPTTRRVWFPGSLQFRRQTVAYSASMTIDPATGNIFTITPTNGTAFTLNQPSLPLADGQTLTVTVKNSSGGALGTATFSPAFKMSAWTQPANGFSRSINFYCDGTSWIEMSRTAADIPN